MAKKNGTATPARVNGPIESSDATLPSLAPDGSGLDDHEAMVEALRAQLASILRSGPVPTARVLVAIPRALWTEAIVACHGCGGAHRHHVLHGEDAPVLREVRCGGGRTTTYLVALGGEQR